MLRPVLILLTLLALGLWPATASAADTVIGFDERPPGTVVEEQYKPLGLSLSRDQSGDVGQTLTIRKLAAAPGNGLEISPGGCGGEFPCAFSDYLLSGRLDFARQFVRVTVLDAFPGGDTTLRAYRSDGSLIDTASAGSGAATPFTLQVDSAAQNIQFITLTGAELIDDVTFDNPANPPPPDFSIFGKFPAFQGPDSLAVRPGEQVKVNVLLNRFNFSAGPINVTALLDTTAGVNVSGSQATSGPDGTILPFTIKVAKNAKAQKLPVTIRASPNSIAAGPSGKTSDIKFTVSVFRDYDLLVSGIEVTQGIQREMVRCFSADFCDENQSLPTANPADPTAAVPYNNVPFWRQSTLIAGKRTVARVFATVKDPAPPAGDVKTGGIGLIGISNGKQLPESPLLPELGGKELRSGVPWVTFNDRADPQNGSTFTLPDSWTRKKNLTLRAELTPYTDAWDQFNSRECTEKACTDNNKFTMSNIPFHNVGSVRLATAWLYVNGESKFGPGPIPRQLLSLAELLIPLAEGDLRYSPGFYASMNVQEAIDDNVDPEDDEWDRDAMYDAKDILEDYADEYPGCEWADFCADTVLGIFSGKWTTRGTSDSDYPEGVAVAPASRLPTLAHEISHNLQREHAGTDCPGIGDNGQTGEEWPPDGRGLIHGIGLDTRPGSGGPKVSYAVIAPGNLGAPAAFPGGPDPQTEWFDQQSYCRKKNNNDADRWTSVTGLERYFEPTDFALVGSELKLVDLVPPSLDLAKIASASVAGHARAGRAARKLLHVQAIDAPGGARITVVKERALRPRTLPDTSAYHLVARDAAGAVLADVPMAASQYEGDPQTQLTGQAAVSGAASIEITRNGAVIASRTRSAAAPKVRVLSPRRGARVGAKRATVVRWKASDADGGDLRAKIDYSFDNGRTFTAIYSGPENGRAVIPSTLLSGSKQARLRVRVSDGFNEGQATSGRFRAAGRPPQIRLISPAPRQRLRQDAFVNLSTEAYDDRRRRLGERGLQWFLGKRRIARGRRASVTGLPAGRRRIKVVARGADGRRASASVLVRVVAVKPRLIRLIAPKKINRRARSVALRVAANVSARLTASGRRYAVGRRLRKIRVPVRRGSGQLRLRVKLTSGAKVNRGVIRIRR